MAKQPHNAGMPAKRVGAKQDDQAQQELAERDRSRVSQQGAKDRDELDEGARERDDEDLGGESEPR